MGDRKYRHRGYQDDDRPSSDRKPPARSRDDRPPREMRAPSVPAFQSTIRCVRCGHTVTAEVTTEARCARCGTALHACGQCASFDPASRFECTQPIPARITPKDAANTCTFFEPNVRVERQTTSRGPDDARSAFDKLFKI